MIYAQYARGYRSSAINGGALTNPADLNVAKPEKLDAYEAGVKTQWLDRKLTFNLSGFLYNFRDQQFINVVGIGTQQLVNAGRSRIYGLEAEVSAHPTSRLSFGAGLGLLHSEYRKLVLNGVDLSGNELIEAPHYTLNLSADYAIPIGDKGSLAFHADATHAGRQFFSALNTPEFRAPAFWDVNAQISLTDPSGRYEIAVYGKNLTDNQVTNGIQIDPTTQTRFTTVPFPRRYGVELTAHF
jgi:iron complex outermembrane receptor protein